MLQPTLNPKHMLNYILRPGQYKTTVWYCLCWRWKVNLNHCSTQNSLFCFSKCKRSSTEAKGNSTLWFTIKIPKHALLIYLQCNYLHSIYIHNGIYLFSLAAMAPGNRVADSRTVLCILDQASTECISLNTSSLIYFLVFLPVFTLKCLSHQKAI